jgi:hypothetical protein
MEQAIDLITPACIPFDLKGDEINSKNKLIESIRKKVSSGEIVILKNVFDVAEMLKMRSLIILWGIENNIFPHGESPSKYPELNYHRIDDGSVPSVCPHLFHQYAFNSIQKLGNKFSVLFSDVATTLRLIQNAIGETDFEISLDGLRLKILQYPEGGGFLTEHTHPLEPQKVGLILSLSRKNIDNQKGAAAFTTPGGKVDTLKYHDIGDVVVFRYDLPHSVTPVNQEKKSIDWSLETGKWSVVLELRDTHGLSHKRN